VQNVSDSHFTSFEFWYIYFLLYFNSITTKCHIVMIGEQIQTSVQRSHSRIKRHRFTKEENSFNMNKLILRNVRKRQRRTL